MTIEKPLEWQECIDTSDKPINLNGSTRFWKTVEKSGLKIGRNGAPEFTKISFLYHKTDASHFYLCFVHDERIDKHILEDKALNDPRFGVVLFEETEEGQYIVEPKSEEVKMKLEKEIKNKLKIVSDFSLDKPMTEVVFQLFDNVGLKLDESLDSFHINYRFVELK